MMVSYFLPNMRGLVAHELSGKGEGQRKIANLLGITQARVSNYLANKKSRYVQELAERFSVSETEIENYSKILSEDVGRSQVDGIFTLYSIWKNLLFSGVVCSLHQNESSISQECSICMELHKPSTQLGPAKDAAREDISILRNISEAISLLENSSTFPRLMPEVSVNIAMSRLDPKSNRDVAAIPGRINKIHGRAKALVLPEFGSSNHMSNVLLMFNSRAKEIRAVMNLRYDQIIDKSLSTLGVGRIFTNGQTASSSRKEPRRRIASNDVLQRLRDTHLAASVLKSVPFALIDRGSEGVEPITYLLGRNASELAQLSLKISHSCSNLQRV
jgi:XRE family transcriptional regulator, thiamine biosynthesis regulator